LESFRRKKRIFQETKKGRYWPFFADRLIKDSLQLLFFLRALLVGYRAGRFACRLAARLALAARGVFARLDAGLLNGLNMLHD
jgi:hypothetical protein